MPEGHTIHRLARDLRRTLRGHRLSVTSPQGRFAIGASRLDGTEVVRTDAFGKELFVEFARPVTAGDTPPRRRRGGPAPSADVLHVHLGLIGRFRRRPAGSPVVGQIRLRLEAPTATWDLSGPMRCELVDPGERDAIVARIGPDPLRADSDPDEFIRLLARKRAPIGAALLDQSLIAGIGNVYRAELLFLEGIHPQRPANELHPAEAGALWVQAVRQLTLGERLNRIVIVHEDWDDDHRDVVVRARRIPSHERLYAYHQDSCRRCEQALDVIKLGGRPIWCCPGCQPMRHGEPSLATRRRPDR